MKTAPVNGDFVKVHMYGERPWVYKLKEEGDQLVGRIDNVLANTTMHGYKLNDVVEFKWDTTFNCWEAVKKVHLQIVK